MSEPAACPGTQDGLHDLELVPQENGTYKAKCKGCDHWLSKEGLAAFLGESKDKRRYVVNP